MELIPLTDEELLRRLRDPEDNFVERKPRKQDGEYLQVMVAFANSTPPDYPAVLFVGVDDDGNPQDGVDPDRVQNQISAIAKKAYPPIDHFCRVPTVNDRKIVAVIVPGSRLRPHFAGKSYVRIGHQTTEANEEEFAQLIAIRQSKGFALQEYVGKLVSVWVTNENTGERASRESRGQYRLIACNTHYLTIVYEPPIMAHTHHSIPLEWVQLAFDHIKDQPALYINDIRLLH